MKTVDNPLLLFGFHKACFVDCFNLINCNFIFLCALHVFCQVSVDEFGRQRWLCLSICKWREVNRITCHLPSLV